MTLLPSIEARIDAIRGDDTHGASWLSREALQTAALSADQSPAETTGELLADVRACLQALTNARPEMAPIRHWVQRLAGTIDEVAGGIEDPRVLKATISTEANRLIALAESANRRAADNAVARLGPNGVIFTASYSQTVVDACRLAGQAGKLRRLLIAESVDPSGHRYGRLMADAVAGAVPEVEVIPDDVAPRRVKEADRVWLGADTVLADGSLLNGTPSLAIARAGFEAGRPVELIGESAKIDFPRSGGLQQIDALPAGPAGMERVPSEFITSMITDDEVVVWPLRPRPLLPLPVGEGWGDGRSPVAALVARIAECLVARHEVLAVAESSTGGRISDLLTNQPGCSAWFVGGIVAYSAASKRDTTAVSAETLSLNGAVSIETAGGLARGAVRLFDAAWGIGETGIAGPQTGRRSSKPAGYACLAVAGPDNRGREIELTTGLDDREANKEAFARSALELLLVELERA